MKRIYRGWCLTGLLLLCIASVAVAAEHTWTGIISDNMCGGSHAGMMAAHPDAKMTAHDCTNACVKAGAKYVFVPVIKAEKAKRSAVRHLIQTFFNGSPEQAVATLLDVSSSKLSNEELDRLAKLIEQARKGDK